MSQPTTTYNSDNARYEAYQFSDPFATAAFVCCNKKLNKVCRPNCDHYPKVSTKEDVAFLFDANQAVSMGYDACDHCDPTNPNSQLDLPLIKITIESINYSIGFTNDANDLKRRAFSVPSINTNNGHYDRQLTRNESEHIKLVELACRHIAAAAALSITKQGEESSEAGGKKKRRGGVLGFKELASKSKLSPWHFHRVFKSVTGLTPKSYGDQCWKFIKDHDRPPTKRQRSHFKSMSEVSNNFQAPKKSARIEEDVAPTAPVAATTTTTTNTLPQSVAPTIQQDISVDSQLPLGPDLFDLNKNSLDINMTPYRHHSLDLGTLSLDLNDFKDTLSNANNVNSNFIPFTSDNLSIQLQQPPQQFNFTQAQVPQPQQLQQHLQVPVQEQDRDSVSTGTELSSLSINPMESSQWSTVGGSNAEVDAEVSKLLTPPSSVGDVEFNGGQKGGSIVAPEPLEFYDVLNKSPLETDDFLSFSDGDYALLNNGGSSTNEVGTGLFLGTDGNEIFNEGASFRSQNNNVMI